MTPTLSGDETKRSSLPRLVDFAGFPQRVPHGASTEAMSTRVIENDLLSPRYKIDSLRQRAHSLGRNDNCTVNVGVHNIVVADKHAKDGHVAFHLNHVHMRVARPDAAANDLKAGREHVNVAERTIGDTAAHSEACMDSGLDLAPECAKPRTVVDVLDNSDGREAASRHVVVPVFARGNRTARPFFGADDTRPCKTNDGRQFPIDAHHGLDGEAYGAALRRDNLEAIADRRGVPGFERVEIFGGERIIGHSFSWVR